MLCLSLVTSQRFREKEGIMAARTYLPKLMWLVKLIVTYAAKYRAKVVSTLGEEVATLLDFLLAIANQLIAIVEANSDAYGNYSTPVGDAVSSTHINAVRGAYNQFMAANGETGDV